MEVPAISVVIPMYNVAKYIGECLDSLLSQSFKNFEVIVVDDCSTDNSVAVVKSYAPKFNGRLKLTRTKKNFGTGGPPRNKAIELARGEYIFFVDADDAITPTALAELYPVAKNFDADIVACEKYFIVPDEFWHDKKFIRTLEPVTVQTDKLVNAPTLITDDLSERVRRLIDAKFLWNVWSKMIRRDFILDNDIKMVNVPGQDMIFTLCTLCAAKNYVLVPNVVNYYRVRENSISNEELDVLSHLRKWFRSLRESFRYVDEFLSGEDFFRQHPDIKYLAVERVWNEFLKYLFQIYERIPAHEFDKILREEFSAGDNVALSVFAFNAANVYRVQLMQLFQRVNELENKTGYKKSRD